MAGLVTDEDGRLATIIGSLWREQTATLKIGCGGPSRLPLEKTQALRRLTDKSQGCEMTPEVGLKNEAPARAYSTTVFYEEAA